VRCGKRKLSFWEEPVVDLIISSRTTHLGQWDRRYSAQRQGVDLHFILNRAIILKWKPKIIMNGLKILCLKVEHLVLLDSVSFLPCPLRKLHEACGVSASKSRYPHYFNTEENLNYVGHILDVSYYGVNEMWEEERSEFVAWYESHKSEPIFENRRVFKHYCQDDVTQLRAACQVFRRDFMHIGSILVFLESINIASA